MLLFFIDISRHYISQMLITTPMSIFLLIFHVPRLFINQSSTPLLSQSEQSGCLVLFFLAFIQLFFEGLSILVGRNQHDWQQQWCNHNTQGNIFEFWHDLLPYFLIIHYRTQHSEHGQKNHVSYVSHYVSNYCSVVFHWDVSTVCHETLHLY